MRDDPDVKWRRPRAESTGLLTVAGALVVLGVLADKWDGPSWLMLAVAVCAAGGGVWLEWRRGRVATQDEQATTLATSSQPDLGSAGQFRTVGETGPDEFRVQPAAVEIGYILRDVQQELHDRLVEGRPVLVVGHSMSGKTRMAYEVVRKLYRDWQVWIPERPDGLAQLMPSGVPQQTVVWLDDLEAFLTSEQQLRLAWLTQLENAGCRVVATIRSSEYEKFQPAGEVMPPQWEVLKRFRLIWLLDNEDEQERIAASIDDEPIAVGIRRYGLAEYVGGGYLALDRFQNGQAAHPLAVGMLRAAADWRRLGLEWISATTMSALAPCYLPDKVKSSPVEDETSALKWASMDFGGRIKLLEPGDNGTWRVFDYLLDHLTNEGRPVPDQTWTIAAEAARLNTRQAYLLAYQAYLNGRSGLALELWQSTAVAVPAAAFGLGVLRREQGDLDGAAAAYQQAIDSGDSDIAPPANVGLAALRKEQGDLDGAATAYQHAIDTGNSDAMSVAALGLAALRKEQGDLDGAATAYRQAIDTGHPEHAPTAALGLGALRKEQGDLDGAGAAYQQAIDTGHSNSDVAAAAAFGLALLHEGQGDPEGAAAAYQQAIDTGHPDHAPKAAFNLGLLQAEQGDPEGAAAAYQVAIDTGHPDAAPKAAVGLGVLREVQGDLERAAAAYQQAIDTGHAEIAPAAREALDRLRGV